MLGRDRQNRRAGARGREYGVASSRLLAGLGVLALLVLACSSAFEPAFDASAPPGLFDSVSIADLSEALTFARTGTGDARRVIAVHDYRDGVVRGVELSLALGRAVSDPIELVNALGYDGVLDAIVAAGEAASVEIPAAELGLPVDLHGHHVAAATNFPEHADDAGSERPFLFAKLVQPTGPYDTVPAGDALLDYEVEIAWLTLAPLANGETPQALGLVVANDFTDRDTLLRHLDPDDIESGTGFATGKSFPGFLPLGNLFVVPRDPRAFAAALELELYVNGALRQRAPASEMIWDLDEIVRRTFAWKDRRWDHRGESVALFAGDGDAIPPRTLLLSGTPHGTVFAGLATKHVVGGLGRWVASGFDGTVPAHVVAAYLADAHEERAFLQPGDRVEIRADRLGVMRNVVVP